MSDPLEGVFDDFANATESALTRMAGELAQLRAELETLRTEQRSAPSFTIPAPIPGKDGENGKDGRGIARVEVREAGDLIMFFNDGTEQNVGRIVGKDGKDGEKGDPGEPGAPSTVPGPVGPKGDPGEPGADGIATRAELDELIETRFADLQVRTFSEVYQGVFTRGSTYSRGVLATWDGSLWLSLNSTSDQPGTSKDWKLIVKKGRDAR